MKVLHLSTFDSGGGAARSTRRLQKGLLDLGLDSEMYVYKKSCDDYKIHFSDNKYDKIKSIFIPQVEKKILDLLKKKSDEYFSINIFKNKALEILLKNKNFDIVNIHWINEGFFSLSDLNPLKEYVITMHDSWFFTGGCHIPYECKEYIDKCSKCRIVKNIGEYSVSEIFWKRKKTVYEKLNLKIVSPSRWLAKCAKSSSLFRDKEIIVIPNGIDTSVYAPIEKIVARKILGISCKKKIICFGAIDSTSDGNKGFDYLKRVLKILKKTYLSEEIELVVFGASKSESSEDLGFVVNYMGRIYDDYTLALIYSSADVFVAPSKSENLPNTVMEALACGTPTVTFNVGGICDLVEHKFNGYLAKPFDVEDFADGILNVFKQNENLAMSDLARKIILDKFDINKIAKQYNEVYEKIRVL